MKATYRQVASMILQRPGLRHTSGPLHLAGRWARQAELPGNWQRALAQHWGEVRFGALQVETAADQHVFQISVSLGGLDPNAVQVELYANSPNGAAPLRQVMTRGERLTGANGYVYSARVPASQPAADYTPRLIPSHPEAAVPLEATQILWQR